MVGCTTGGGGINRWTIDLYPPPVVQSTIDLYPLSCATERGPSSEVPYFRLSRATYRCDVGSTELKEVLHSCSEVGGDLARFPPAPGNKISIFSSVRLWSPDLSSKNERWEASGHVLLSESENKILAAEKSLTTFRFGSETGAVLVQFPMSITGLIRTAVEDPFNDIVAKM